MKQAIAGVTPASVQETTVTTVWPSICRYALGQCLGQLYGIRAGFWVVTAGNLIALASIPVALALYFLRVAPFVGVRYRLTNQRIVVARGIVGKTEERSLPLDKFDAIEIHVRSGQEWFDAGDLIFVRHEGSERIEAFRLEAVSRPQAVRQICLKARQARVGVLKAQQRQAALTS